MSTESLSLRPINAEDFRSYLGESPQLNEPGPAPRFMWLKISKLRVDPKYQREILRNGARNIADIARNFSWNKFGAVMVAKSAGNDDTFSIVDGQHRTYAAALRGMFEVPCLILEANFAEQAEAFVAMNNNVTRMSPLSIFQARLAAKDEKAEHIQSVCEAAGVTICRYPVPAVHIKPAHTLAIGTIERSIQLHGAELVTLAMRCIVETSFPHKNKAMLNETCIRAVLHVLSAEPSYAADANKLLSVMAKFDFADALGQAAQARLQSYRSQYIELAILLFDYMEEHLG